MMERINLDNYEAYFLDFVEGNLTPIQIEELNHFLFEYPELKSELDEFELIVLEEEKIDSASLKEELLREETTGLALADYLMISEIEGTITKKEKAQLANLAKSDASLMEKLAAYHKTKLPVEDVVVFTEKSALLQKERKVIWWQYASVAAAAILFFVVWNTGTDKLYSPRQSNYAQVEQETQKLNDNLQLVVEREGEIDVSPVDDLPSQPTFTTMAEVKEPVQKKDKEEKKDQILEEIPSNDLAEKEKSKEKNQQPTEIDPVDGFDDNALADNATKQTDTPEEFVPLNEFAKQKIKKDLLKGKTFSETIIDELAEASKEKITFEREKSDKGSTQKFALNIGKFSISRNK